jgi:hypothetical protein
MRLSLSAALPPPEQFNNARKHNKGQEIILKGSVAPLGELNLE